MRSSPSTSLCIVCRDEAAFIADCIRSAAPVVDEVIVVDTGSADGTPEIARRCGAEVVCEPWPGDLGRAHDLPLERARCDWILTLDADEALDPDALACWDELLRSAVAGHLFTVRNYEETPALQWRRCQPGDPLARGAPGWAPSHAVRLFRNDPRYRNSGHLHQSVLPAIRKHGGAVKSTPLPIHHYGPLRSDRSKGTLYLDLAQRQVQSTPRCARSWHELGVVQSGLGQHADATQSFFRSLALADTANARYFVGRSLVESGLPASGLRFLHSALERDPDDAALDVDHADIWEEIARAHEDLGDHAAAGHAYRRALSKRSDGPISLSSLAALLVDHGRFDEAWPLLARLESLYPAQPWSWTTSAYCHLKAGQVGTARHALQRAQCCEPNCDAVRRALRKLDVQMAA